MSIFSFDQGDTLGKVEQVDTGRVWAQVATPEDIRRARVGRLVAIKGVDVNEWVIGMIERVWRKQIEDDETPDEDGQASYLGTPPERNGVLLTLVGTYRAKQGTRSNVFTRAVLSLPSIDEDVYPIEGAFLEAFMGIISDEAKQSSVSPLEVGAFSLDTSAKAYLDGNKLFQRHSALLGSTGSGKSCTVALILEQAAKLPNANVIVFDLHGEYRNQAYARQLRIAGPADLESPPDNTVFLPYWLMNYEEMQTLLIDRSEQTAHNQAALLRSEVYGAKRASLEQEDVPDVLASYTIDSPVPFDLAQVVKTLRVRDEEMVKRADGKGEKQGDFHGKLTRLVMRLEARLDDRRYGFMFQPPADAMTYGSLHQLARLLIGHGTDGEDADSGRGGVKVLDFSEVPSDVLPVVVSIVARLLFQIELWMYVEEPQYKRHPVLLVCDEAHLYLPRLSGEANPLERRAVENFERLAKEGRKYGVGLLIVSQRPADVSATILSQCNNFVCLRLTNGDDQAVVRRLMPESLRGMLDILPTLDTGEAVVVGDAILLPTRVNLSLPTNRPISATIDFWTRWSDEAAKSDVANAVENMRRQRREKPSVQASN